MKKAVTLLTLAAVLLCMMPGLALAETQSGNYSINSPGTYTDINIDGYIIIRCSGPVNLVNVSCHGVIVVGNGAVLVIDESSSVESVVIEGDAAEVTLFCDIATFEVTGVAGSYVFAGDVSLALTVADGAYASDLYFVDGTSVAAINNFSDSTTVEASFATLLNTVFGGTDNFANYVY